MLGLSGLFRNTRGLLVVRIRTQSLRDPAFILSLGQESQVCVRCVCVTVCLREGSEGRRK